jgi:hypothetical protein
MWVISGSADRVDGLPHTRPMYLNKRTRAGPAGGVSNGPMHNAQFRTRCREYRPPE